MPSDTISDGLLLACLRDPEMAALGCALVLPAGHAARTATAAATLRQDLCRHARRPLRLGAADADLPPSADETAILRLIRALGSGEDTLAGLLLQWLVRPAGRVAVAGGAIGMFGAMAHLAPGAAPALAAR